MELWKLGISPDRRCSFSADKIPSWLYVVSVTQVVVVEIDPPLGLWVTSEMSVVLVSEIVVVVLPSPVGDKHVVLVTEVVALDCVATTDFITLSATILRWTLPVAVFGMMSTMKTWNRLSKDHSIIGGVSCAYLFWDLELNGMFCDPQLEDIGIEVQTVL